VKLLDEFVKLLGFLGALRDYSYIDRVGNAIDEVTLLEALKDAVRAYFTNCIDQKDACIQYDAGVGVKCPEIQPEDLERAVAIAIGESKKSRIDLSRFSRSMALKAYAAIPRIRLELSCTPPSR